VGRFPTRRGSADPTRTRVAARPKRVISPTRVAAILILGVVAIGLAGLPAAAQALFQQNTLTGNWGGLRQQLAGAGVTPGLSDSAEILSNPVGGITQGTIYDGLLTGSLDLDLDRLLKWRGATFHVDGYLVSGRGLSQTFVGNLLTVSDIEALPTTRLHDLWLEQRFLDATASIRIGQIAFDDEFYISQYSTVFINSTFGCPDMLSTDWPGGGPCYPFAVPGLRLRIAPTNALSIYAAVFNGNPAPPGPGDPQVRNSSGTNFLIGEGGTLAVVELDYSFDAKPGLANPLSDVKLGAWYDSAEFPDLRFDDMGLSLASPSSNGIPATHVGDYGLYLILDKMLWQPPKASSQGLGGFLRIGGAPGDRNLINLELDAGFTCQGLLPGRQSDVLGVAFGYVRIAGAARGFASDHGAFAGIGLPGRDFEGVLEVTYALNLAPWWVLQPDFQLILHPGGNVPAPLPAPPNQPIPSAVVVGLRSRITF
jgi:porin